MFGAWMTSLTATSPNFDLHTQVDLPVSLHAHHGLVISVGDLKISWQTDGLACTPFPSPLFPCKI